MDGKGHNGAEKRNEYVMGINLCTSISFQEQMEKYWKMARKNHITQIIRVVQSFSVNEFNPNTPDDILKANVLAQDFVDEFYPDRQAVICTQTDGKGGCEHNHILINDVSMVNHKGCDKEQYYHPNIMKWTDTITEKYTLLDHGKINSEKLTQTERVSRQNNFYSYKDDIRKRVKSAIIASTSKDDFLVKCTLYGVDAVKKSSKKYGEYYTYELVDLLNIPESAKLPNRSLKARSYNLGEDYDNKALQDHLDIYKRVINNLDNPKINVDFTPHMRSVKSEDLTNTKVSELHETAIPVPSAPVNNVYAVVHQIETNIEDDDEKSTRKFKKNENMRIQKQNEPQHDEDIQKDIAQVPQKIKTKTHKSINIGRFNPDKMNLPVFENSKSIDDNDYDYNK